MARLSTKEKLQAVKAIFADEEPIATPQTIRFKGNPQTPAKPVQSPIRTKAAPAAPTPQPQPPKAQRAKVKKSAFSDDGKTLAMTVLGADSQMYNVSVPARDVIDRFAYAVGSIIQLDFHKGKPVYKGTIKRKVTAFGMAMPDRFHKIGKLAAAINRVEAKKAAAANPTKKGK